MIDWIVVFFDVGSRCRPIGCERPILRSGISGTEVVDCYLQGGSGPKSFLKKLLAFACRNDTHTRQNHTLRVEITLVRVKITVVSVVITFVRFNITLRVEIILLHVEIALCIYKSHWCVLKSHWCVLKSHFTFRNYTRA
jgi:hypothetical protein